MSIDTRAKQYGKIFGDWNIREFIGNGSGGKTGVFRIIRNHDGWEESCALKVVNVIEEFGRREQLVEEYLKDYRAEQETLCNIAAEEVRLMYKLRGSTNVVHYLDWQFSDWEEENQFGRDLLIRMDFLNSLEDLKKQRGTFEEKDVLQIGKDICAALIQCEQEEILHRDIKPGNIFVNSQRIYLLGDFGIARIVDSSQEASTRIGTHAYAAPEQFRNEKYDKRVDIYSLGLTLYELLNQNHLPFAESGRVQEEEIQLRIRGKKIAAPKDASPEFAKVIIKACAHKPEERYQSAEEFLDALKRIEDSTVVSKVSSINVKSVSEQKSTTGLQDKKDPYATILAGTSEYCAHELPDDAEAQFNRGICYRKGLGVKQDDVEAVKWYKKAADQGHILAQFALGVCCHNGIGVKQDDVEAVKWYKKAAEYGNTDAQFNLGLCYDTGIGTKRDDIEAVKWYRKAAEQGNADAQFNLGVCYHNGLGIQQDGIQAVKWYRKAAEQGNADAQFNLGVCYNSGVDVERDDVEAVKWYRKAAEQGNVDAQFNLGVCYDNGNGVKQDYTEAVKWYKKAAIQGDADAEKRMKELVF